MLGVLEIKPKAAGSGNKYANHCAMLPKFTLFDRYKICHCLACILSIVDDGWIFLLTLDKPENHLILSGPKSLPNSLQPSNSIGRRWKRAERTVIELCTIPRKQVFLGFKLSFNLGMYGRLIDCKLLFKSGTTKLEPKLAGALKLFSEKSLRCNLIKILTRFLKFLINDSSSEVDLSLFKEKSFRGELFGLWTFTE